MQKNERKKIIVKKCLITQINFSRNHIMLDSLWFMKEYQKIFINVPLDNLRYLLQCPIASIMKQYLR